MPQITIPFTHVGLTTEELSRRANMRDLRECIAKTADLRTRINRAYRLPHASQAHRDALEAIRVAERLSYPPPRELMRREITAFHVELAALRGKKHLAS